MKQKKIGLSMEWVLGRKKCQCHLGHHEELNTKTFWSTTIVKLQKFLNAPCMRAYSRSWCTVWTVIGGIPEARRRNNRSMQVTVDGASRRQRPGSIGRDEGRLNVHVDASRLGAGWVEGITTRGHLTAYTGTTVAVLTDGAEQPATPCWYPVNTVVVVVVVVAVVHCVSKKCPTLSLSISLPNIDQFLKFLQHHALWTICCTAIIECPTTP